MTKPRTTVPVLTPQEQTNIRSTKQGVATVTKPRTIVPMITLEEHLLAAPIAPLAVPHLTYHNGHLLTNVQVVTIFWGAAWAQPAQSALIPQLNAFFDFILTSSLIDLMGEYSVSGQTIGHGSRIGTATITTSEPGGGSGTVSDAQIQTALQGWINNNTVPAQTNNTLYFIYLPPGVTSTAFGQQSCTNFCGYHSAFGANIFYAVEPFLTCGGCTFGDGGALDSLTKVSSHELCEAITDPNSGGWWDDTPPGNEIGDICNNTQQQFGGFTVQLEWSNQANACRLKPATLPTVTWSQPTSIVYGTALSNSQLNATADEAGNFVYNPLAGTCLPAGTHTLSVTFTPTDSTHQTVTATVQLTILKATPIMNWANPANIVYGTALNNTQENAFATWVVCGAPTTVSGIFVYNPPADTCLSAGTHALSVIFTPNETLNYNNSTATVLLTVLKATPIINWANPPDIDHTDPLPSSTLNAIANWNECGTLDPVPGSYTYNHAPGDILPIGTNTLSLIFTPTDSTDYNIATATVQINVLTGNPIVMSVTFSPTTIPLDIAHPVLNVTVTVKNDSIRPHDTQGPNPGFEYSEGDTFTTKGFPSINGAYRIGVDLEETTYSVNYLYRWGFGKTLAPGESVLVTGAIRCHNVRHNGHYYAGMIQEPNQVMQDHQGTTVITVVESLP